MLKHDHDSVLRLEKIDSRSYLVTLFVMTRPVLVEAYLQFYTDAANVFAFAHDAKVVSAVDVDPLPFRDSAYVKFTVREFKNPGRPRTVFEHHDCMTRLYGKRARK